MIQNIETIYIYILCIAKYFIPFLNYFIGMNKLAGRFDEARDALTAGFLLFYYFILVK